MRATSCDGTENVVTSRVEFESARLTVLSAGWYNGAPARYRAGLTNNNHQRAAHQPQPMNTYTQARGDPQ